VAQDIELLRQGLELLGLEPEDLVDFLEMSGEGF